MRGRAGNVRRRTAGFTMVEVMVAMTIAAVAIVGILSLVTTEIRASDYSRRATEATVLAQDRIEQLRALGAAVALSTVEPNLNERGGTAPPGPFTRTSVVTVGLANASVVVTTSWADRGVAQSVTVRTIRSLQ